MATDIDTRQATVTQLYIALFGRAPDAEGLDFWGQRIQDGQSINSVANTMRATAPGQEIFPEGMSSVEIVDAFYRNVLGRDPDPDGLIYWSNRLESSSEGLGGVINELIEVVVNFVPDGDSPLGQEGGRSRDLFMNRVQVGQHLASLHLTPVQVAQLMAQVTDMPGSVEETMAMADAVIPPPAPAPAPAPAPSPDPDPSAAPAPAPAPAPVPPPPPPPPPPPAPTYTEVISGPGPDPINLTSQEEHVLIATGVAARNAEKSLDFSGMSVGQSVTVGGLMLKATQPMSADEVAAAFASGSTLQGNFSGSLADWSVKSGYTSGSSVAFESATVDDLPLSTAGRTETVVVTFKSLDINQTVTVDGVTLLATGPMTDQEVAQAFETGNASGKGTFSGTMTHWDVAAGSRQGAMLTFESREIHADVAALALTTQGRTEEFDITFTPLLVGQSLTLGNQSLTATQDMSAADVAAAFNGPINGWIVKGVYAPGSETLTFISTSPLANVTDITVTRAGAKEQCAVVFDPLSAGQSVTIGGRSLLAINDMSVSQVINDLIFGSSANCQITGTLAGWDFVVIGSNYILFDSQTPEANVTDLSVVVAGRDESATVTFQGLLAGQGIEVGGWKLTALVDLTASQVAALFAGGDASGQGTWSGSLSGWAVRAGYTSGAQLTFDSSVTLSNVTNIAQASSGRTEVAQVSFTSLLADQSVTVAGKTLTASATMTAEEVADAFNIGSSGLGTFSGGLTGWTIQAGSMNGDTLTFLSNDQNHSVTDLSPSVSSPLDVTVMTVQGVDPPAALSIVTVDGVAKPADLGVVEVDGAAAPASPLILMRQGATTPASPDMSVTQGFAAPAGPVVTVTATVALHADSASPAVPGQYDVVTGFSVGDDHLDLPVVNALYGSFNDSQTSVANLEITQVLDGMVTFGGTAAATASLDDRVQAVLTAMGDAMVAAAFVMDDGQGGEDTYVVYGDGAAGVQDTDTLVKLSGIAVIDLYAILV